MLFTNASDAASVGRASTRLFQILSAGQRAQGIGSFAVIPEPTGITVQVGVAAGKVGLAGGCVDVVLGWGLLVLVRVAEAAGIEVQVAVETAERVLVPVL